MSEALPNPERYIKLVHSVFGLYPDEELIKRGRQGVRYIGQEVMTLRYFEQIGVRPMRDALDRLVQDPVRIQQLMPLIDTWLASSGLSKLEKDTIERGFGLGLNEGPMKRGEIAAADHVAGNTVYHRIQTGFRKLRREDHARLVNDFLQG